MADAMKLVPVEPTPAREGVYVASRASIPERGKMWRDLRASGVPITSTWIDEDGPAETADFAELWPRIQREVMSSERLVCYLEPEDFPVRGVLIEIGMAMAAGVPIYVVAPNVTLDGRAFRPLGSWIKHPLVQFCQTVDDALAASPPAREEAPGEGAGELGGQVQEIAVATLRWALARGDDLRDYKEPLAVVLDAADPLRARTSEPAREAWGWAVGGRAVPLVVTDTDKRDWWLASGATVQPLYTHPAPATADKLKVAKEALEPFAADHECDGHATVSDYDLEVSLFVRYSKIVAARQALATLNEDG